jgi:Tfp pilus assembly protein PilV
MFNTKKSKNCIKRKKSFSMLEAIMSVAIVSIGLVAALSLLSKSTRESMDSRDQVIAGMLAQEGVEIVRNIRDNNWVNSAPSGSFNSLSNGNYYCDCFSSCSLGSSYQLNLNGNNYYVHSAGTATRFFRKITLSGAATNYLIVYSVVLWGIPSWPASDPLPQDCVAANKCAYTTVTLSKWGE